MIIIIIMSTQEASQSHSRATRSAKKKCSSATPCQADPKRPGKKYEKTSKYSKCVDNLQKLVQPFCQIPWESFTVNLERTLFLEFFRKPYFTHLETPLSASQALFWSSRPLRAASESPSNGLPSRNSRSWLQTKRIESSLFASSVYLNPESKWRQQNM